MRLSRDMSDSNQGLESTPSAKKSTKSAPSARKLSEISAFGEKKQENQSIRRILVNFKMAISRAGEVEIQQKTSF